MNLPEYRGEKTISIKKEVEYVELHPLVVRAPIIIEEGGSPVLLSMVPSNCHHLLTSVQLKKTSPEWFLRKIALIHAAWGLNVTKSFFISDLAPWKEVVLMMSPNFGYCFYREGDQYFYKNLKAAEQESTPLTPLQYALEVKRVEKYSRASDAAIRAMTGGHESEAVFAEELQKHFPTLSKISSLMDLLEVKGLSEMEKESLVFYLMEMGRADLALQYFKNENLSPNMKSLTGVPLICSVVKKGGLEFVKHLMEKNVVLNVDFIMSPLHIAVEMGNNQIVSELIQDKQFKIDTADSKGWTPISLAAGKHPAIFEELKKRGASVNTVSKKGFTPLSIAVNDNDIDTIDQLLEAGADPNLGIPSALEEAIYKGNLDLIKHLIQAGGKVFARRRSGEVLFNEALKRSDPEIIEYLLQLPDCQLEPEAIAAVIESGNFKKIEMIRQKGGSLPDSRVGFTEAESELEIGIGIFIYLEEWEMIEKILQWVGTNQICAEIVGREMIKANPKKFEEFIRMGLIHQNVIRNIFRSYSIVWDELDRYKDLLIACVEMGADITSVVTAIYRKNKDILKILLQRVENLSVATAAKSIETGDIEIVKIIVEKGVDINADPLFCQAVQTGNLEIIDLFIQKGVNINFKNPQGKTPLEFAGTNKAVVKRLLELGAQWTEEAAANVVQTGDLELIRTLKQSGADIGTEKAYIAAVKTGKVEVLEMVRKAGGNIKQETITKLKLLLEAYQAGGKSMFLEILPLGGSLEDSFWDRPTLWDLIAKNGDMESFKEYLKHETNLQIPYKKAIIADQLPLVLEVEKVDKAKILKLEDDDFYFQIFSLERVDIMKHFFDLGTNPNMVKYGRSLFLHAVSTNKQKALKLFLEMKLDPNQIGGIPPISALASAVKESNLPIVKMLLDAGATVSPDAIEEAKKIGNKEIFQLLNAS
jgi:ankyrin repeat protein